IHSKAVNVHDFAWFASEYYIPYSESVEIDNEFIRVNVFVNEDNENWELPMKLAKRALTFFSEKIGPYPYPQMTLVESSCESQSGMEYPMITILNLCADSQQVDHLIAHEIAHNWFYGVIASNERDHAWMDEGLTSYFDHLYNDAFYENSSYYEGTPQVLRPSNDELTTLQNGVIHLERTGYAMSIDNPSIDFDPFNYLGMNYEKTAWIFKYLSQYIGDDAFEACVQSYYKKWQFKHPSPNDLLMHFHACCHKDISWLDSLISRKGLYFDYKIKTVKQDENELKVIIGKKGFLGLPYQLCGYDTEGKLVTSKWIDQLSKSEQIVSLNGNGIASLEINGEVPFLDYNRSNNNFKLNKVFKKSDPIKFRFLGMGSGSKINAVNFIPTLLYNKYDGLMLGSAFYSDLYPQQNFRWFFNPNYGTRSKSLAGSFGLVKDFPLKAENLRNLRIELFGKHFHYLDILNVDFSYSKLQPAISLNFAKGIYQTSQLEYKMHIISNQNFESSLDGMVFKKTNQLRIHQINFRHFKKNALSTNRFQFQLEYEKYDAPFNEMNQYLKASFEVNKRTYYNENSQFFIRLYGGYFIMNDQRESSNFADIFTRGSLALTSNGLTDHTYESYYLNRSALSNKNSPGQFEISDGGFKNTYTDYNTVGMSNDYLLSLNLKSDLPFKILKVISTRPYLDLAYSSTKEVLADPLEGQFYYSAGLSFEIGDIGGIYLPLFNSENLNINYTGSSLFSRLSFRINFNALSPWRYSDEIGRLIE
ncbi:MAG: hypothetical protein HKN51_09040, partial [Saprospiraceae bacterium]|nr:hypothetical protein [Saprospiraceae bacterium]